VIVQAGGASTIIQVAARCFVEDEDETVLYEFALQQWEKKVESMTFLDSESSKTGKRFQVGNLNLIRMGPTIIHSLL
jgi:hypothetical protein